MHQLQWALPNPLRNNSESPVPLGEFFRHLIKSTIITMDNLPLVSSCCMLPDFLGQNFVLRDQQHFADNAPHFVPGVGTIDACAIRDKAGIILSRTSHPEDEEHFSAAFCPKGFQNFAAENAENCPRCRDYRCKYPSTRRQENVGQNFPSKTMRNCSAAFCPKGLQNFCCRMGGIYVEPNRRN